METILKTLGADNPFDENGDLTVVGADAYEKLIAILWELNYIGAITETVDSLESYFDTIIKID